MSNQTESTSGANQNNSSGNSDGQNQSSGDDQLRKDMVSYETHRKLLNEKKNRDAENADLKAKLDAIEAEKKSQQEAELKAKEDYKKILELRDQELLAERQAKKALENQFELAHKWDSFSKALNGQIDSKFATLVDLDEIIIDPTTKQVDQMSVTKAVEKFRLTYPEVLKTKTSSGMPQNSPQGNGSVLSYDEWLKLPAKEMAKRRNDIDKKTLPT